MSKNKKQEKNPIEQAIGPRAEEKNVPPQKVPPMTDGEIVNLEELQMQTMERLQDPVEDHIPPTTPAQAPMTMETTSIPVVKQDDQNVTKTSSPESPPQDESYPPQRESELKFHEGRIRIGELINPTKKLHIVGHSLAEEKQLVALNAHIASQGFNVATVGAHLNILCSQPMVIPSITTWQMKNWQRLPEMVYKILVEPGFLDAIWPALKIVLGTNVGNVIWTTGIATTFAFFSVIQTLPFILEMEKAKDE